MVDRGSDTISQRVVEVKDWLDDAKYVVSLTGAGGPFAGRIRSLSMRSVARSGIDTVRIQ